MVPPIDVDVGEATLGDGDVERPRLGVVLDLALLAVQAGLGPGCHIRTRPGQTYLDETRRREASYPGWDEILCKRKNFSC